MRDMKIEYLPPGDLKPYENGATVATSFITNLDDCRLFVSPELYAAVDAANKENERAAHKDMPKYSYPVEAVLAAQIYPLAKYGQTLRIPKAECIYRNRLDAQKDAGKDAFGGLFIISERAAAEKAAAEKAAATKWKLSEREKEIVRNLGRK